MLHPICTQITVLQGLVCGFKVIKFTIKDGRHFEINFFKRSYYLSNFHQILHESSSLLGEIFFFHRIA